jgi:DeoR family transcriptional regulator of aga operon
MNPVIKRHQIILQYLQDRRHIEVLELCRHLNVSAVTIRKDLKLLEEKGLLYRNHGGASIDNPYIKEKPVNEKEKFFAEQKIAIATAAAGMITPNDSIIIASGTTVLTLAKLIQPKETLTVVTSALNIAMELLKHPQIEILQLAGYIRHSSSSVTGHYAENILEETSCSKLFLGVDGIDIDYGLTTTSLSEAHLNQKMIAAAHETIVLADSSKFGKRGFGRICGIEHVKQIITDKGISEHFIQKLEELGISITIV